MGVRWRGFFLFLIALLIAWASIWLNHSWVSRNSNDSEDAKQSKVSHYFTNFTLISTNITGEVEYTLSGQHFSRWSGKDWSEILIPHLISFDTKKISTDMTADKAIMRHEQDVLELYDSVAIKGFSSDPSSILNTELLRYHPKKQWIETDSHVTFTSDSSTLTGKGMDSKLDENTLRIHSNVHSTFKTK